MIKQVVISVVVTTATFVFIPPIHDHAPLVALMIGIGVVVFLAFEKPIQHERKLLEFLSGRIK